ncbi:unnamed protein product [Lactuca virosa]|uniref:Germacrene A synthase n=1 Tax=Lactuca virosa TaxID=75947 RepID=A0AAU9PPK0_9ASTR|nr:unnamed protein product [Lactuca virosa]
MEPVRPLTDFPPSMWGDRFLPFSLDNSQLEELAKAMEEPKEQLRRLIIYQTINSTKKLSLIYYVYRLGLSYHFMEDIDGQLDKLFKELNLQDYHEADLYTISILFHVFRSHGYKLPSDVFKKFKDCSSGAFKEDMITNVKATLNFYECTQLRIRGESILDEAFVFTEAQLKSVENTLEGNLAQQVKHALKTPFQRGHTMVEAKLYFLNYQEECSTYDSLLNLAKVHIKWWKDMNFDVIALYARNRVTELYVWVLALFLEPYYSHSRIITSKVIVFLSLLDDTYDAYATIEEMRLITHAINRWEISAMGQLPEFFKPFYEIILKEYDGFKKQIPQKGRVNLVEASKHALQEQVRSYHQEAEWRHIGYVPSFEEYMKNGLISSSYDLLSKTALVGMGKIVTEHGFAWHKSHPKILTASETISRLHDDAKTFEYERERGMTATEIDAYMKTFGVSENVAVNEIMKKVENAWEDINEGCLKPREVPMDLISPIVNLARMTDVAYRYDDGYTFPEKTFKEYITLLFLD